MTHLLQERALDGTAHAIGDVHAPNLYALPDFAALIYVYVYVYIYMYMCMYEIYVYVYV